MKKHISTIIFIVVLIAGLSLLLYPTVSDWWNSLHQSRAVAEYAEYVGNIKNELYQQILDNAYDYNDKLTKKSGNRFIMTEEELETYTNMLDITGTGMIGYLNIPVLQTTLPIYHGTSDSVLSAGIGHLEGSSLPVGGKSTHCVLSGHRGLPSTKLLTNLDKLVVGDLFILHILDETLTYEVDQIRIVEPQDVGELAIIDGMDYCTLVTCTPYGINTHRLLVRGHRVANTEDASEVRITSDAIQIEPIAVMPFVAAPILLVLFIILLLKTRKKKPEKRG
mgnify:FL=1